MGANWRDVFSLLLLLYLVGYHDARTFVVEFMFRGYSVLYFGIHLLDPIDLSVFTIRWSFFLLVFLYVVHVGLLTTCWKIVCLPVQDVLVFARILLWQFGNGVARDFATGSVRTGRGDAVLQKQVWASRVDSGIVLSELHSCHIPSVKLWTLVVYHWSSKIALGSVNHIVAYFQIALVFKVLNWCHITLKQVWRRQSFEGAIGCLGLPSE